MRETIPDYLKRHGFRKTPWDVWVPEDLDLRNWPEVGSKILIPSHAIDELGYPQLDKFVVLRLVFRKGYGGQICYWQTRDCLSLYRLDNFETACWDAVFAAAVRSVPVTLNGSNLWKINYEYNRKHYMPDM